MLPLLLTVRVFAPLLWLPLSVRAELVVRLAYAPCVVPARAAVPPAVLHRDQERVVVRPLHARVVRLLRLLRPLPVPPAALLALVLLVMLRVRPP